MKKQKRNLVDIDEISTWTKYKQSLCARCNANCCTLPVEVNTSDLVRMGAISAFEAEEPAKNLSKKLKKMGIVDHFHYKTEVFTLARFANNDCIYLDQKNRRCTIYEQRPDTCRNHPTIGPHPGYCPFEPQTV